MTSVPKTMSTQHPDNVHVPFFSHNSVMEGDDEVKEAFYAYSNLGCQEQLWDCEGKEVDTHVVKKLLSHYEPFFVENRLGKDVFLTLRVPNPEVEKSESKILLETLESIPRNFDIARMVYNDEIAPIFEVALPMTSSVQSILRLKEYYAQFVAGKSSKRIFDGDVTISQWIGEFFPEKINIIPLFETTDSILSAHEIVNEYIEKEKPEYMRVWLARSDPALNYGMLTAVLINKISLRRLHEVEEGTGVEIFPILGCGSAPFRGNFRPTNLSCLEGYPSVQTFTIQSAFKYDYDEKAVRGALDKINSREKSKPIFVEEEALLPIVKKISDTYALQVREISGLVNEFSRHIPARRKRNLHIGLFGYSRKGKDFILPRAIPFCASLYSLGLPPELFGLSELTLAELETVRNNYRNFDSDLKDAMKFVNSDNFYFFPQGVVKHVEKTLDILELDGEVNQEHKNLTGIILDEYSKKNFASIQEHIVKAGAIRGFLG